MLSFAQYRAGIVRLGDEEQNGEDIEKGIAALSNAANVSIPDVRAAITEYQDLIAA